MGKDSVGLGQYYQLDGLYPFLNKRRKLINDDGATS